MSTVVDLTKRSTLKVISVSAAAAAVPVWSVTTLINNRNGKERLDISIYYESGSNHGTVVFGNPTNQDIIVNVNFDGEVSVPGGILDVRQLMVVGSVHIKPGSSRRYQLPKLARIVRPFDEAQGYRHGDQRFPISDNVIIANANVTSDYKRLNGITPVFLIRSVS
jgi:hypothetical protein